MCTHSVCTETAPRRVPCSHWNQAGSRVLLSIMGQKFSWRDCRGCWSNEETGAEIGV